MRSLLSDVEGGHAHSHAELEAAMGPDQEVAMHGHHELHHAGEELFLGAYVLSGGPLKKRLKN